MSLLFHQSVNMEQVISIGNYKKVGREPYFFNPQTNNLEGQFFLSAAPYRRLLQNVRCRLRRKCLYGEALGLQKPKPDCYYHQDIVVGDENRLFQLESREPICFRDMGLTVSFGNGARATANVTVTNTVANAINETNAAGAVTAAAVNAARPVEMNYRDGRLFVDGIPIDLQHGVLEMEDLVGVTTPVTTPQLDWNATGRATVDWFGAVPVAATEPTRPVRAQRAARPRAPRAEEPLNPGDTKMLDDFLGGFAIKETLQNAYTKTDEFGYISYTDEGIAFASKIFEVLNEVKDNFTDAYSFNIESVPAERAAVILCQKDNVLYDHNDKFIYSNQWIPLSAKCTIQEKLRLSSILDEKCSGGSIAHINLESNFPNTETAWKMLNKIAQAGVIYFAFNTRINECKNHHGFVGTDHCPVCGEPVFDTYQRIVGYLVPSRAYSKDRFREFNTRQWYSYAEAMSE